jgi:hypothetical protein
LSHVYLARSLGESVRHFNFSVNVVVVDVSS